MSRPARNGARAQAPRAMNAGILEARLAVTERRAVPWW